MATNIVPILLLAVSLAEDVLCLDNGVALTPPMGWLSWERFLCNVDCADDPMNCISEQLYKDMADRLVADGYKDLGYEYVNIDDCWMANTRYPDGRLQPNSTRFPSGIKALADYVHGLGLKLGIYQSTGNTTCAGYPGSQGYFEVDARTFAEWEVDMLKLDGCRSDPKELDYIYPQMTAALNKTGRPIVFSCNWPYDQIKKSKTKVHPNYTSIAEHCNMWRNYYDISDTWKSVSSVVDYYDDNQDTLVSVAGPGQWNDPDMLVIGNFGLSLDQSKTQMALWSIYAAPLFMSNDLREIRDEFKSVLQNKEIIDINQDPLGQMGKLIFQKEKIQYYTRPVTPVVNGQFSYAVAVVNRKELGGPVRIRRTLTSLNLTNPSGYSVRDLYSGQDLGFMRPEDELRISANPSGVVFLKAEVPVSARP